MRGARYGYAIVEEEPSRRLPAQSPTHNGFVGHVTGFLAAPA